MDITATFHGLSAYSRFVLISFIAGLFFLTGYRLMTGAINTRGLLYDKSSGGISPARVQLLLFSLSGAFYYLMNVIELVHANSGASLSLPAPSNELLALVLGSNTVYLTAKATSVIRLSRLLTLFR